MTLPSYFLTFTCYGTWLHGDARGSVDREHNRVGTPYVQIDEQHHREMALKRTQQPYSMDAERRTVVLDGILNLFERRAWELFALHIRSNHVHLLGAGDRPPDRMMLECKAAASRMLNRRGYEDAQRKRWTRGGSTIWVNFESEFDGIYRYILFEQGKPMARWPEIG